METTPNQYLSQTDFVLHTVLVERHISPGAPERVLYSLTVEDVQTVAGEEFGIKLTAEEIDKIERLIDFDWYETFRNLIGNTRGMKSDR